MFWGWKDNKFIFMGGALLRVKARKGVAFYYLLGICIFRSKKSLFAVQNRVDSNRSFDTTSFDKELEAYAPQVKICKKKANPNRVAYLITELYDWGGHTKCVVNSVDVLRDKFEQAIFVSHISRTDRFAPQAIQELSKKCMVFGDDLNLCCYVKKITKLFNQIVDFNPKVLFVWMHPSDCLLDILLGMLKRYTNIKILYCPHASHFPNLGISYADAVLEALSVTAYITQNLRKCDKTIFLNMMSKSIEESPVFNRDEVLAKRKELGIKDGYLCTMSGAMSYKFFEGKSSSYFEMIRDLLEKYENLQHVILSHFSEDEMGVIESIFGGSKARSRLSICSFSKDYELIFKCADVFIDSFPVSSALTMIDLMRLRIPYVVKINDENAMWSFHEYQKADFPYMFAKVDDLMCGVETLLFSKEEREKVVNMNYLYYQETYDKNTVKKRMEILLDNVDDLKPFFTGRISGNYKFKDMRYENN